MKNSFINNFHRSTHVCEFYTQNIPFFNCSTRIYDITSNSTLPRILPIMHISLCFFSTINNNSKRIFSVINPKWILHALCLYNVIYLWTKEECFSEWKREWIRSKINVCRTTQHVFFHYTLFQNDFN